MKIINKVWQILTVSFATFGGIVILLGTPAVAQTPQPAVAPRTRQQQVQQLIRQRSAAPQQMPDHLVGVEAGNVIRWTMKDAILVAPERNPDIEIGRQNVRLA